MAELLSPESALDALLTRVRALGADAADVSYTESESLSVDVRMGAFEGVERSEGRSAGLRAFIGKRQAGATTSDLSRGGLEALAERVVSMARMAPEDPYCGLLAAEDRAGAEADLDSYDATELTPDNLEELAMRAEETALAQPGVTNSAGAGASWTFGSVLLKTSDGFRGQARSTSFSIGVSPLAERDGQKERDWEGRSERHLADVPEPEDLGRMAGARAVARLGSRKIESRKAPVVFERRVAGRLLGPFFGAISGPAVARAVSFLKDKLGEPVFARGVEIEDDPFARRGMGSRLFDGEGAAGAKRRLVEDGVLTTWLLNAASARQLGLRTTGHATLAHGGPPGVSATNVTLRGPGGFDEGGFLKDCGEALLVTEMFSPALNPNTGDWSVGVAGFWCEGGERAFPVSEITVAGNLLDMFARLEPGADLERRGSVTAPTVRVADMAIAGV